MEQHSSERYKELARKWLEGTITPEEAQEYAGWYNQDSDTPLEVPPSFAESRTQQEKRILRSIERRMTLIVPLRSRLLRVASAAAVALLIIGSVYLYRKGSSGNLRLAAIQHPVVKNDAPPGGNKAILTLSNGTRIILDSTHNGMLASQGGTKVVKMNNGLLAYNSVRTTHNAPRSEGVLTDATVPYNTLSTPRGGQYRLILPDGSKVWLNAASSIRYPTAFTGDKREVEITGEVYFEVAKNAAMPFIVKNGDATIQVLGTDFNVNAYDDEPDMNVTLVEGSVRVIQPETFNIQHSTFNITLTPGQQAVVEKDGQVRLVRDADTDDVVAWKNGLFEYSDASAQEVLRQMARWYNVEVVYEVNPDVHLAGVVSRNIDLSQAIALLQTNGVNCKIENGKIMVLK